MPVISGWFRGHTTHNKPEILLRPVDPELRPAQVSVIVTEWTVTSRDGAPPKGPPGS